MRTICITLEYQGTEYCGWQMQPNGISVQQKVMEAVFHLTGEKETIHGSGRTDAGVHARGQSASFRTNSLIPSERWAPALNAYLPDDIAVIHAREVDHGFHARYSALGKQYSYHIFVHPHRSPLMRRFAWHLRQWPDLELMKEMLRNFEGTHDFSAFRAARSDTKDAVRTIWKADLQCQGNLIQLIFQGNGFLYKMVRMLTAATVQVGLKKQTLNDIIMRLQIGEGSHRKLTAPPQGLYLDRVYYSLHELPEVTSSKMEPL